MDSDDKYNDDDNENENDNDNDMTITMTIIMAMTTTMLQYISPACHIFPHALMDPIDKYNDDY